jgi:prepilin-type N-terminal cleavage/methylation domain-containing protein
VIVSCRARPAVTLLELLIVLAVLGIALSVVTVAAPASAPVAEDALRREISVSRRDAVALGVTSDRVVRINGRTVLITAWPDGRVLTDSVLPTPPPRGRQ